MRIIEIVNTNQVLDEGIGDMFSKAKQFVSHNILGSSSGRRRDFETFLKKAETSGAIQTIDTQKLLRQFDMLAKRGDDLDYLGKRIWDNFKRRAPNTSAPTQPAQSMEEGENWSKHNNPKAGGMSKKSVSVYRRENPGSKIQTAVTTKPSKLKKGSKAAKRRKSFCARMRGMKKSRTSAKTARDPNSNINKSLRRWNCESVQDMKKLVQLAEQFIREHKE